MSDTPSRLVIISDVDPDGARRPVLVTSDPEIVETVEGAVRARLGPRGPEGEDRRPGPLLALVEDESDEEGG